MLVRCNHSELVILTQEKEYGAGANRCWPRDELLFVLRNDVRPNARLAKVGPFDKERDEIMAFIERNRESLAEQLRCNGNCYAHSDAQVMWCWLNCMHHIERGM